MARDNYREIQKEHLRRSSVVSRKPILRAYHEPEPIADMIKRLSKPLDNGCHEWLGKIGTGGYAYISYRKNGKRHHKKAATVAYKLAKGAVPDGREISHTCANRRCVNPDHLIAETHSENLKRRKPFSRFKGNVCKRGHSLPPLEKRNKNGACPICYKENQRRWREENKEHLRAYFREYDRTRR